MPTDHGRHSIEIEGILEPHVAGPGEPILWSIHEDGRSGPEGVHPFLNGDIVTVHGENGAIVWTGTIDLDFDICQAPDPEKPMTSRQAVLGRWVHGVQKGEDPEAWAEMFFESRRATLKR